MSTRIRGVVVAFAVSIVVLAGCSLTGSEPSPGPSHSESSDEIDVALSPSDVVVETELAVGGSDSEVLVYPLVRADEYLVLTVDFLGISDEERASFSVFDNDFSSSQRFMGVRLVDLVHDEVYFPGIDRESRNVVPAAMSPYGEQRLQLVYADPGLDIESLTLFLPGAPLIDEVPIIDGEVPSSDLDGEEEPLDVSEVSEASVFELESFTRELDGAVETLTSSEEVQVTLGSDVLFEVDEHALTKDAAKSVKRAADHLEGREPGTITIVGHTDDVLDADYNQKLSENRAEAVAEELKTHIDVAEYPVETEGRGKSDPLVANSSDENRAKNRRVTLTLVSEITETVDLDKGGELPEFDAGPSGTGEEGIEVGSDESARHYRYTASAREIEEHLVVDLKATALDDAVDSAFGIGGLAGVFSYRGDDVRDAGRTASAVQVLDGTTSVYALDHYFADTSTDREIWLPLTTLNTLTRIDGGQSLVFSVVYPRGGDWDDVTIRVSGGLGVEAFELTDIPVE